MELVKINRVAKISLVLGIAQIRWHPTKTVDVMMKSWGCCYFTMTDRRTRYFEAIPLQNNEATTVTEVFYNYWIYRSHTSLSVRIDQSHQFESYPI